MNKADLIGAISKVTSSKKVAGEALDCMIKTITGALKKKEAVTLIGFGTFATSKRKARAGRNPQTGQKITIKAKTVPVFRPGKSLKDTIK